MSAAISNAPHLAAAVLVAVAAALVLVGWIENRGERHEP